MEAAFMTLASGRILRGLLLGSVLWLTGFVAGMLAFMIPDWRSLAPIPGLTPNPAVSGLALLAWLVVTPILARRYVTGQVDPAREGLRMAALATGLCFALDCAVLGVAMKQGFAFFSYASIWVGYALLFVVPVLVGRSVAR